MAITRIEDVEPDTPDTPVTLKASGNILEVRFTRSPAVCPIRKVSKDWGVNVLTGEAVEFKHTTTRAGNLASVAQSLRNVRDLINYYNGDERKQFSFYRIPKLLVTGMAFRRLSTDAKLLYGLLLDRMSLSLESCGNPPL